MPGDFVTEKRKDILCFVLFLTAIVLWALFAGRVLFQGDTFWHLKAGQWISQNGIPYTDPLSWTAQGLPWHAHEWLWELAAYKAWNTFGKYGIWLLTFLGIAMYSLGVYIFCGKKQWGALLAILSMFLVNSCWSARPHVLAQGIFALWFALFANLDKNPRLWPVLPGLVLVLSNTHASTPICLAFGVLWCFFEKQWNKPHIYVLAGSFLASLVNPWHIGLWVFAFKLSFLSKAAAITVEWFSPDFKGIVGITSAALIIVTVYKLREIENKGLIACYLLSLALYLFSMRHEPYFIFFAMGVLAQSRKLFNQVPAVCLGLCLAMVFAVANTGISIAGPEKLQEFEHPPFKAIQYMKTYNLTENVFNYSAWGGMLAWEGIKPAVDGRMDLYEFSLKQMVDDYWDITNNKSVEKVLDRWNAQVFIWPKDKGADLKLAVNPKWQKVYSDKSAVVFVRKAR